MKTLNWIKTDSSVLKAIAYDKSSQKLYVTIVGNVIYSYDDVEEEVYMGILEAESCGKAYNEMKKAGYKYKKEEN